MAIRSFLELSIELEGFKPRATEQPEVIDPKTGKPYNLKDPALPVVHGHTFRTKFWAMPKVPSFMLLYLNERYDFFNRDRFNGKLKKPALLLLKDVNAATMKKRGHWSPRLREIRISPSLFNAPHEGWLNRTLIHEMCHQEVTDFFGEENEQMGHGPKWTAAMIRAGLVPSRFDYTANETYMDKKEKKVHELKVKLQKPFRDAHDSLKQARLPVLKPKAGDKVVFALSDGVVYHGVVVGKAPRAGYFDVRIQDGRTEVTYEIHRTHLFFAQ